MAAQLHPQLKNSRLTANCTRQGIAGSLTFLYAIALSKSNARGVSRDMKVFPGSALTGLDYHGECRRTPRGSAVTRGGQDFYHFVELATGQLAVSVGEVPVDATSAQLFYARIDGMAGELNYVNAGHECVLLVRFHPERVWQLESTEFRERTLPLESGDLLLAATHGVTDAVNETGRRWTVGGLLQTVMGSPNANAAGTVREIMRSVNRFAAQSPPAGDRTVVAVRFHGRGEQTIVADRTAEPVFAAA